NAGAPVARNRGFQHTRGEYVVFLDHDDRLLPGALESQLNCLLAHRDCAFSFGDTRLVDGAGVPMSEGACATIGISNRSRSAHEGTEHYISLLRGNYIWTTGMVMHRRSVFEAIGGFDSGLPSSDDLDLNLRIARSYPVCHNDRLVLEKRQHESNLSRNAALTLRWTMTVLQRHKRWVRRSRRYRGRVWINTRLYESLYGKPLLHPIRAEIRRRKSWRCAWTSLLVLVEYAPLLPARCVYWKAKELLTSRL